MAAQAGGEMVRAYYLRMAKRADFMRWLAKHQMEERVKASGLAASQRARAQLSGMMNSGTLQSVFGSEIAGVPTETVLAITQSQIWGGGML